MGWELEYKREPAVSTASSEDEVPEGPRRRPRRKSLGPSFFTLSGGILKRDPRTSNRIDALLTRMMEQPEQVRYSPHVERNLDYLHTSLQLDMISMVAEDYVPPPPPPEARPPEEL